MSATFVVIGSVLLMIASYAGAAVAALFPGDGNSRRAAAILAAAGALAGSLAAAATLVSGGTFGLELPSALPAPALAFRVDALGAAFLFLIGLVAAPAALYGIGYAPDHHPRRGDGPGAPESGARGAGAPGRRLAGVMFPLFLMAMSLLVTAHSVFTFLLFWEAMTLSSYFLVVGPG
ncbi:MAG: hypothetical protein HYS34_05740, partial [Acidobacteria bacterium]|nr:hypothetical protein [Acidobacteriota bacterium]